MVKGPLPLPYPENFIERADFQRKSSTNAFFYYVIARSDCFCRAVAIPRKGTL